MKKIQWFFGVVIAGVLMGPAAAGAQGTIYERGTTVRLSAGDTLSRNVFAAGELVEVRSVINNDLFAAGRQLTLAGTVADDALMGGEVVTMRGSVGDMLAAAGETVLIDGPVQGDLFAAGREVRLTENAVIGGNAALAGERIVIESGASVGGWMRAAGGSMELNGSVRGQTRLYTDRVTFGTGYRAGEGTVLTAGEPVHRENLGSVPADLTIRVEEEPVWTGLLVQFWFFLSLLITGLVLIRLFERQAIDMQRFARERFWKRAGIGLLGFILIPLAILLLAVLVLTLPLAVILALAYGLALFISYLLVAMTLGVMSIAYFRDTPGRSAYYWGLLLGMIYIALLTNLPFIGWFVHLAFMLYGLGCVIAYIVMIRRSRADDLQGSPAE